MVDNIAPQAYVVCCLMPLLAFLLLAWQTLSHALAPAPPTSLARHEDARHHQAIVSLGHSLEPVSMHQPHSPRRLKKVSVSSGQRWAKHGKEVANSQVVRGRRELEGVLAGCGAGLAEMTALNECYWGGRGGSVRNSCRKECRVRTSRCEKGGFRPAPLAVIVEGLQY